MNLVKLLTVGRSLNGNKTIFGKYKMVPQVLPKFASTVRPSGTAPAVESLLAKAKLIEPQPIEQAQTEVQEVVMVISVLDKTQKIPAGKILKRMEAPVLTKDKVTLLMGIEEKVSAWKKKLLPVRSRKKSGTAPVQTEWPLGQVTVARNDLSDADLEVVASKKTFPARKSHLTDLSQAKKSGSQWIKKKTSQLFRSTSPFEQTSEVKALETSQPEKANRSELAAKI